MTVIQIPDEQAALLQAKAAAQGLTLEAWLKKLADFPKSQGNKRRYDLADLVAQCDLTAPQSAEDSAWIDAPAVGREAL
jgi:antitoxin component of MazEF toxin-antitoxin module